MIELPSRPPVGELELEAVKRVIASDVLSGFVAESGDGFLGGPEVRRLEEAFCAATGALCAVAMNSATSALAAAVQAVTEFVDDEVIVSPWSMTASAACAFLGGAVPVFADIEDDTYGLSLEAVKRATTERTKAVVMVDLFGCVPRDAIAIHDFCALNDVALIEDASQAIGAYARGREAGTLGDVGIFSLNQHKTIRCGEGGVAVTFDAALGEKLRLIRNHGEAVVPSGSSLSGLVGGNYRLPEMEAAVAGVQLERLEELTAPRVRNGLLLSKRLVAAENLVPAAPPPDHRHVYYLHATRFELERGSEDVVSRFIEALNAEGVPVGRYVRPLYHQPLYRQIWGGRRVREVRDSCPVAERCWRDTVVHSHVHAGMTTEDVESVAEAFLKVCDRLEGL